MYTINTRGEDLDWFPYFYSASSNRSMWPAQRWRTSAVFDENHILLWGGQLKLSTDQDRQMYVFDISNQAWRGLNSSGAPEARFGHTATLFDGKIFYVG